MPSIRPEKWSVLSDRVFAAWAVFSHHAAGGHDQHPMAATCVEGAHRIWLVDREMEWAWLVAEPVVVGNLVPDMRFVDGAVGDRQGSPFWQWWVRAMFVPRVLGHSPHCVSNVKEQAVPYVSTVGTFMHREVQYWVESHPKEVRVVDKEGVTVVSMPFKPGLVLGMAVPGGAAVPVERLDELREQAIGVLAAEAREGRGPWARLEQPRATTW